MPSEIIVLIMNAISLSSILIIISVGLAIIFGMMGVINLAHGEFFMLGAYVIIVLQPIFGNFWIGMLIAPIFVGIIGVAVEWTVVKRLYTRPLETLLATWGVSIIIRQLVRLIVGPQFKNVNPPFSGPVNIFGAQYSGYRLFIIAVAVIAMILVAFWLYKTKHGMQARSVIANREMSAALGINTANADRFVFSLGAALAGLAGAIMAPLVTVSPEMGINFLAQSFLTVVVGGMGTLWGVIGGGAVIGGGQILVQNFASQVVAQVVILVVAILVIRIKPQGLFGR